MMNEIDLKKKMLEELMGSMDNRMASRIPQGGGVGLGQVSEQEMPGMPGNIQGLGLGQMSEREGMAMEDDDLMQRLMRAKSIR